MWRRLASLGSILVLFGLVSPLALAQTYNYDFDGHSDADPQPVDPTDWMTSENWSDGGFDPGVPPVPNLQTRVEITDGSYNGGGYGTNAPVIGPGDMAQVYELRIGRANGPGTLSMTGGTLDTRDACNMAPYTCDSRIRVGNADVETAEERFPGYFNVSGGTINTDTLWIGSGSHGEMTVSGGTVNTRGNLYFDWTSDLTYNTNSVLNMTDGLIHVGSSTAFSVTTPGNFRMYRLSSLNLDGGQILVDGAAELGTDTSLNPDFTQTPDVTVHITDGMLESKSFLRIGGSITLDGGVLRAKSFNEAVSAGTIEINGTGLLQFQNSMESVSAVEGLITGGFFTTSEASPLVVQIVDVGGVSFTQVSVDVVFDLQGDYNGDDVVNAADYTVWRNHLGEAFALTNETASLGTVDEADYEAWKSNFGATASGSGAGSVVPEPTAIVLFLVGAMLAWGVRPNTEQRSRTH